MPESEDDRWRRLRHATLSVVFVLCLIASAVVDRASAALPEIGVTPQTVLPDTLSPADQLRLAERFAPSLLFHPEEVYFPSSPLFPIERIAGDGGGFIEDASVAMLGTYQSRRDAYTGLDREGKAALATVYYRAYPTGTAADEGIVVEYWFYYVENDYRVRGNAIPLWFNARHPNDLEHVHIVLKRRSSEAAGSIIVAGGVFEVTEIIASSHEGTIPANRYRYPRSGPSERPSLLVERGSHALAPDIDLDGVFTPGRDGESGQKMLWGIRDRGVTWPWFDQAYMDPRVGEDQTRFDHVGRAGATSADGTESEQGHFGYQLVPVADLARNLAQLNLTDRQRKEIFETRVHWFNRVFGKSNGNSDDLLVPPEVGRSGEVVEGASSAERGVHVGFTKLLEEGGAFVGGRYSFLHGIRYLPDLMFEADGILTTTGKPYISTQAMLTYPIDANMRLMGGGGLVLEPGELGRRQWDWIAAFEVRLGRMRVYTASRTWGVVTRSAVEFRLSYFF